MNIYYIHFMGNYFDITEFAKTKHGRITILKEVDPIIEIRKRPNGKPFKAKVRQCLCRCDCGKEWLVWLKYIKSGRTKSCGCLNADYKKKAKSHGMGGRYSKASEYIIWASMIQRCTNPNEKCFKHYGGRGITVCEAWRKFENFFADMGKRPGPEYTIDRKKTNGNYEKSNCRWTKKLVQMNNKRNNHRIEYNGRIKTIAEWSRETGINISTLKNRIRNNWPVERAMMPRF